MVFPMDLPVWQPSGCILIQAISSIASMRRGSFWPSPESPDFGWEKTMKKQQDWWFMVVYGCLWWFMVLLTWVHGCEWPKSVGDGSGWWSQPATVWYFPSQRDTVPRDEGAGHQASAEKPKDMRSPWSTGQIGRNVTTTVPVTGSTKIRLSSCEGRPTSNSGKPCPVRRPSANET